MRRPNIKRHPKNIVRAGVCVCLVWKGIKAVLPADSGSTEELLGLILVAIAVVIWDGRTRRSYG